MTSTINPPNFAARWARRIIQSTQPRRRPIRMLVFVAILLAWLGLTGAGSYIASGEADIWRKLLDALYGPLTFLAPQDGYINRKQNGNLQDSELLWLGRFFGTALPVMAILWVWLHWSRMAIARMLMRHARGHIVILGRDGAADAIASSSSREGACVVLVESGVSDVRLRELEAAGVLVVSGGADQALTQVRADRAECVLAWSQRDAISIADAVNASNVLVGSSDEIVVHVESEDTQRALRHERELLQSVRGRLRPISIMLSAVRMAMRDDALVDAARTRGQERVHVGLHGGTEALQAVAVMVLRHNWSIHLRPPRVSHLDVLDGSWSAWEDYHPTFFRHAQSALQCAPGELVLETSRRRLVEDPTITRHIVDHGEDSATLRAAFNLASELAQLHESPPPVQPMLRDALAATALIGHKRLAFAPVILLSDDRTVASLIARAEDEEAARVHQDYLAGQGDKTAAASVPWNKLPETFVHANRAAADHNAVKKFDITVARAKGWSTPQLQEALAKTEHDRWSIERLLDGWAPGQRDNDRLIHDNLVAWDELPKDVKTKDYVQIDKLLTVVNDERRVP